MTSESGSAAETGKAELALKIVSAVVAIALLSGAVKSVGVIQTFDVQFGTKFWFINGLIILNAGIGVLCIGLLWRRWRWAVWVCAIASLGISLIGVGIDLNPNFLVRWDAMLPWIFVVVSLVLDNPFARPWNSGGLTPVVIGTFGFLLLCGVVVRQVYQEVEAERAEYLEPLNEVLDTTNQQLPQMVNEELRLDRVAVVSGEYHQYLTFPDYTLAELQQDPGLEFMRDYYSEVYLETICAVPLCQERLANGEQCDGVFHHEFVDMHGELVMTFSVDGSECQVLPPMEMQ